MGSPATFPSYPFLQKLNNLDKSSPEFHDQLNNVLYTEEYIQCVTNVQGDNLTWLVDFLDNVSCCVVCGYSGSCRHRPSTVSLSLALLSGNVYVSSKAYVDPGKPSLLLALHLA